MGKDTKTVTRTFKRVSDILPKQTEVDEQVEIASVFGRDIILESANLLTGNNGEYVFIVFKETDTNDVKTYGFSCGGKVVVRKIKQLMEKKAFPCISLFEQIKDYYDMK